MKISALIETLQGIYAREGDIEVRWIPKARACKTTIQRFEITSTSPNKLDLKPIPRT